MAIRAMKVLDLFCGSGGAAWGFAPYFDEILGVDKVKQPYYPFNYVICDIFDLPLEFFEDFDFIWASPPCQAYSFSTKGSRNRGKTYPDLVEKTRQLLDETKKPYVIENVPGAPIRKDLMLCGEMFGLKIIRHRYFEVNGFHVPQLKHIKHKGMVANGTKMGVFNGNSRNTRTQKRYTIAGHQEGTLAQWQEAMKISWVGSKSYLAQCVPPTYSDYILNFFKEKEKEAKRKRKE